MPRADAGKKRPRRTGLSQEDWAVVFAVCNKTVSEEEGARAMRLALPEFRAVYAHAGYLGHMIARRKIELLDRIDLGPRGEAEAD